MWGIEDGRDDSQTEYSQGSRGGGETTYLKELEVIILVSDELNPPFKYLSHLSDSGATLMSTRKVVFPAQGYVEYDLVESSTSRGTKTRLTKSKKSLASSRSANISKDTPPNGEKRPLKRRRTDSEALVPNEKKQGISSSHTGLGSTQYPDPGSYLDNTAEDFNPEIFLPMDGRTSDGKVSSTSIL